MIITNDWRNFVKNNLSGIGLEIGALHAPFPTNNRTVMTYQDRLTQADLKIEIGKNNKDVDINKIICNGIVSDAEVVPFPDGTFDFVCTSHVFEHLKNPVKALYEWIRVIKEGGHIFMVVPDKRYTFDKDRDLTYLSHIDYDYEHDVKEVELEHYEDFYTKVHKVDKKLAMDGYKRQDNIHVHTFTEDSLIELLSHYPFKIEHFIREGMNICVLIKKEAKTNE